MNRSPAFVPHGMCFLWHPDILALHVVADSIVALCYFCIPVLLLRFVAQRPSLRLLGGCCSAFIVACGLTHLADVWTIWHPDYWMSGGLKAFAAVASVATVAAMLPLMPYARALKHVSELDARHAELESQYGLIVRNANDGIWLTDTAGRTTFVNTRMTELLGYTAGEIESRAMTDFLAGGRVPMLEASAQAATIDLCFLRKDGVPLWTETTLRTIAKLDGSMRGTVAIVANATERRAAERALADSERQYRELAEAMPHPVFTTGADGTVEYYNQAWYSYTGLRNDQLDAADWQSVIHLDDVPRIARAWHQAVTTGESYEQQSRFRRAADGEFRWFVTRATPVRDPSGAIARWIGTAADIHDFKLASETRSVLDLLGHMISIRNAQGGIEYLSPSWTQFAGSAAEGDSILTRADFVHPDDVASIVDLEQTSLHVPLHVRQKEIRLRAASGLYRWFLASTVALPETDGTAPRRIDTLTDIDDLKRVQAAFGSSERRYRALTEAIPQMVWIVDSNGNLEYVNERWSMYTGFALDGDAPRSSATVVHPDDLSILAEKRAALRARREFECELRVRRHDGAFRWHLLRTVPLGEASDLHIKWIVSATDIEARKSAEAALANSAAELDHRTTHDALTNLPSRATFLQRLATLIAEAERDRTEVVVLYLDIDRFKAINDTLGHNAGDVLLIETAARINATLRADDTASRFGGDEFVLACAPAGAGEAASIAERLAAAVREPIDLNGRRVVVSASIGVSVYPNDATEPNELVGRADVAMYEAKEGGRNAWILYSAQSHAPAVPVLEFEIELRAALAAREFVVFYQPIISLETGRPVGAEALVRWNHPLRGLVGPDVFIPFAENHGLIAPIGEFVLETACRQLSDLRLHSDQEFSIAINVSARQFQKDGFVGQIAEAISEHGLDARRLEIEITESIVMCDSQAVTSTLDRLEALGVKLSLDDFGTGYSSLAYIKNFPIHTLKIDRSFVTDLATNFTDQAIAKTIVTLAHSLGMRVIAEGVETPEQFDMLRSFGADCVQGYLVGRPMPPAEFAAFMTGSTHAELA